TGRGDATVARRAGPRRWRRVVGVHAAHATDGPRSGGIDRDGRPGRRGTGTDGTGPRDRTPARDARHRDRTGATAMTIGRTHLACATGVGLSLTLAACTRAPAGDAWHLN